MSKDRPKIYQHTSGGGHELIHNNPSPLEALNELVDYADDRRRTDSEWTFISGKKQSIKQTLTNYANMVERLEEVKKQYKVKLSKSYIIREAVYRKTLIDCIADITKVLEGNK
jgi:hypothetical protein